MHVDLAERSGLFLNYRLNIDASDFIKTQKFPNNLLLKYVYNRLYKPTRRAQRNYEKYLGKMASKIVKKSLPEFQPPAYIKSNDYATTGNTIILLVDDAYFKLYRDSKENVFIHHVHPPYLYLEKKLPD